MPSALAAKLSPKTAALELLLTEELWANSVYFDSCKKKKKKFLTTLGKETSLPDLVRMLKHQILLEK